jgi:hypothetical protein
MIQTKYDTNLEIKRLQEFIKIYEKDIIKLEDNSFQYHCVSMALESMYKKIQKECDNSINNIPEYMIDNSSLSATGMLSYNY